MIHVAYRLWGGDSFYAKMLAVSMLSMFENTKEKVTVHVMHNDRLTPDNRGKFYYIADQYKQNIEFHNVEEISGKTLRKFEKLYPIDSGVNAAWYPFIAHEIFPNLEKVIFFGTDTVINLDIAELWEYDLKKIGYGLAAVPEILSGNPMIWFPLVTENIVNKNDYCNSDVLLANPKFFLENHEKILEGCKIMNKFRIENKDKFSYCDQDIMNYLFSKDIFKLPKKFNVILNILRMFAPTSRIDREIYHFAGSKPGLNIDDIYHKLYLEYFLKTPYVNVDMFGNIHKACKEIFDRSYNNSKNDLLHFTNLLTHRKRAFFVNTNNLDAIRQIFEIKDDELVIESFDTNSAGNLLLAMKESQGKKIFFILFDKYLALRNALIQRGFVENVDFVDILSFLSEKHGVKVDFDSREILQEM